MISIPTLKQGGNFFGSEDDGDEENVMVCLGPIGPEHYTHSHNFPQFSQFSTILTISLYF